MMFNSVQPIFESKGLFSIGNISYGVSNESTYISNQLEVADHHLTLPFSMRSEIKKFSVLAATWKAETTLSSSITNIAMNNSYQGIIGMGKTAIPFILHCLEKEADHWFWALKAITGEDPVLSEERGNMEAMRLAWLKWGKENAYI